MHDVAKSVILTSLIVIVFYAGVVILIKRHGKFLVQIAAELVEGLIQGFELVQLLVERHIYNGRVAQQALLVQNSLLLQLVDFQLLV